MQDEIKLEDGDATHMGDGVFILFQTDEETGQVNTVVVTPTDLARLIGYK